MPENLYEAHRQWAIRPADERFPNIESLLAYTETQKGISKQEIRQMNSMRLGFTTDGGITINGSSEPLYFSHWAFGQLCSLMEAPAKYLRTLPAHMVRDCLHYGLARNGEHCKLLIREDQKEPDDDSLRVVSAFTSESYGRIWDVDIVKALKQTIEGTAWHTPPARSIHGSENSGLYASDHDMFAFLVNDENPMEVGNAKLGKGFFCWNSETGASTFGLTTFLYNYICGNHIIWGAENVRELKIYHRSQAPERFYGMALPLLNNFVENPSVDDNIKSMIDNAMALRVGNTVEDVIAWFENRQFTGKEIVGGWETGKAESEDVTNLWGMVQGMTAYARDLDFTDKRVNLERRAGALLKAYA